MHTMEFAALGSWLHHFEPIVAYVAGLASGGILLGSAIASWIAPSKKKDCIFRRQVV